MLTTFFLSLFIMLVAYIVIWFRVTKTLSWDNNKHQGSLSTTDSFQDEKNPKEVRTELTTILTNGKTKGSPTLRKNKKENKKQKDLIGKEGERSRSRVESEKKLAVTLFIVTAVFIVTWLPFQIINVIVFICGIKYRVYCIPPINVIFFCKLLNYSNSFINPVVYSMRLPDFRFALKKIIFKKLRCLLCLD
jgi:hypothetical protein